MAAIGSDIEYAAGLLRQNELVGIPTETVYGLAGNALSEEAVLDIFKTKNRPSFDPLIVHAANFEQIENFVEEIPYLARQLGEALWPGPLTILLKKQEVIPDLVTSGLETVAVRIPRHPMTMALLQLIAFPLAAPSANPFGYISPTSAGHVNDQLGDKIRYIMDGGPCAVGVESTIVSFAEERPEVLRLGGQPLERIEEIIGKVETRAHSSSKPDAPGMLDSHYAPRKGFYLGIENEELSGYALHEIGGIVFKQPNPNLPTGNQFVLSKSGDLDEAAKNLFGVMRELDQKPDIRVIVGELVPNEGIGRAINDRLKRAAAQ